MLVLVEEGEGKLTVESDPVRLCRQVNARAGRPYSLYILMNTFENSGNLCYLTTRLEDL